jgi:DNA-binding response OmpR family regulator
VDATSVLVVSPDALAAALLGALVEIDGYAPRFARRGESPRDALRRLRPAVVLVDCGAAEGGGATVVGPARMLGVRVVAFAPAASADHARRCAEELGVAWLALPPVPGALRHALDGA